MLIKTPTHVNTREGLSTVEDETNNIICAAPTGDLARCISAIINEHGLQMEEMEREAEDIKTIIDKQSECSSK